MSAISPHDPEQFFASVYLKHRFSQFTVSATVAVYLLAGSSFVPYAIAGSLEGFKLGTIVVYGYLLRKALPRPDAGWFEQIKPLLYVGLIRFFQLMVLSLYLLCTMAVIARKFDRSDMPANQDQDMGILQVFFTLLNLRFAVLLLAFSVVEHKIIVKSYAMTYLNN